MILAVVAIVQPTTAVQRVDRATEYLRELGDGEQTLDVNRHGGATLSQRARSARWSDAGAR